jgi:ribosomal protein S27AE
MRKTMLCGHCGYPVNKNTDRIVVSTFTGGVKRVRWYCPADCGNGGVKGILGKARQLLRLG